jgi:hypothetical protein
MLNPNPHLELGNPSWESVDAHSTPVEHPRSSVLIALPEAMRPNNAPQRPDVSSSRHTRTITTILSHTGYQL